MLSIKFIRILRGKSQFQVSLETEIPSYRLSLIESSKVDPRPQELRKLAEALQTTPEVLKREISEEALVASGTT